MQFGFTTLINRPVETVFEFLANPENETLWTSGVQESRMTSEGPVGVGSTWLRVERFLGREMKSEGDITEWEPNKKMSFRVASGPLRMKGSYTFEASNGATKLGLEVEGEMGGFFRFAEPLLKRMAQRQMESDHANLKGALLNRPSSMSAEPNARCAK